MDWILPLALILIAGKLLAELFTRLGQSAVVGEIVAGVIIANVLVLSTLTDPAEHSMEMLAEIGVIFMMLMVGLETRLKQILSVGRTALLVGFLGVVVPFGVAYLLTLAWGDQYGLGFQSTRLFFSAVMVATSIAVAARVFIDMGVARSRLARTILAAAVLDDIFGLLILTGVLAVVGAGGDKSVLYRAGEAGLFLLVLMPILWFLIPRLLRTLRRLEGEGSMFIMVLGLTFGVAHLAEAAGLAAIIGVFLLGMILAEGSEHKAILNDLKPLYWFLGPIFFVHAGMQVELEALSGILVFGLLCCVAAIFSKIAGGVLACCLAREGWRKGVLVGTGMVPRGEVGLIIATIGHDTKLPGGRQILSDELFAAAALVCLLTIVVVPPMLKAMARRWPEQFTDAEGESE